MAQQFQFITDVLGVAPLGASSGDGNYFPVDHDEYIQIPGSALKAEDGSYQLHITEELHEVSYLDQVQLFAVDHPSRRSHLHERQVQVAAVSGVPPFTALEESIHAVRATEDDGTDATARVAAADHVYPDAFRA